MLDARKKEEEKIKKEEKKEIKDKKSSCETFFSS